MDDKLLDELRVCFDSVTPMGFTPRNGQLETCHDIIEAFDSGKTHVVYEGPTGSGKSIVAMVIARYYEKVYEEKTVVSTITKSLQDQYLNDFPFLNDIRSSSNEIYRCEHGLVKSDIDCKSVSKDKLCNTADICPYKNAMRNFIRSYSKITNLQFLTRVPVIFADMAIIDEAHELAKVIASAVEFKLQRLNPTFTKIILKDNASKFEENWDKIKSYFEAKKKDEIFDLEDMIEVRRCLSMLNSALETYDYDEVRGNDYLKSAISHCRGLVSTLQTITGAINTPMITYENMMFKPIYASSYTDKMLFNKGKRFLHLSATICGFEGYCEEVGIDLEDAVFIQGEHIIPAERRELRQEFVSWMSMKNYDKDLDKTVDFVDNLIDNMQNKNTILHTVSYKRAEDIAAKSRHKIHVPRSHKEVVELLRSKTEGIYVASPSIVAGIDAKDDMARLNIICKVPFPSFGDPRIKYISTDSPRLFNLGIVRDLVQAAGRSTRHEEDYSFSYIIDGNFKRIYNEYKDLFPKWFCEAVK